MKQETKDTLIFWSVVIGCVMAFILFLIASAPSRDTVIIEDEVVDVDLSNDEYMIVTFSNGDSYNIDYSFYSDEIDFTVNSKMKIKLSYTESWLFKNTDEIWHIVQVVKIPTGGDSP